MSNPNPYFPDSDLRADAKGRRRAARDQLVRVEREDGRPLHRQVGEQDHPLHRHRLQHGHLEETITAHFIVKRMYQKPM